MDHHGMTIHQIMEGVYHLGDPFGVHATLITGSKRALLIDTCSGICNIAEAVRELTQLPLTVINTHGHCDHIGGNYQFEKVYMNPSDMPVAKLAQTQAVREKVLNIALCDAPPAGFHLDAYRNASLMNTQALSLDMTFDLGDERICLRALPNHTPGSVGLLCTERRLLLTGDCVAPLVYLFFPEACSLSEHIRLLRALQEDNRFDTMLCSHSAELLPKENLDLYITCAQNAPLGKSYRFCDPVFSQYIGRRYIQLPQNGQRDCAVIVFNPDKLT